MSSSESFMYVHLQLAELTADTVAFHYDRYSVSTPCLVKRQAKITIRKHMHGVFGSVFFSLLYIYRSRTEHPKLTRLNPPAGFVGRDWIESTPEVRPELGGVALKEDLRLCGPTPMLAFVGGRKSLDWSGPIGSRRLPLGSTCLSPIVRRK